MPNKSDTFHYYQRLKEDERPVKSLLQRGAYQTTFAPTQYVAETTSFYRFATEDSNGDQFWYFVHKSGYIPDPVLKTAPEEQKKDGFLNRIFPQFKDNTD